MPAYLITTIARVDDAEAYAQYKAAVPALVARHGGSYLVRSVDVEAIEGGPPPVRVLVLAFPAREAIHAMFADPDYAAIADLRRRATTGTILVATEL